MAKWKLLKERPSIGGTVDFFDTGEVFESDDPHGVIVARQADDGCSYAAAAAPASTPITWAMDLGRKIRTALGA